MCVIFFTDFVKPSISIYKQFIWAAKRVSLKKFNVQKLLFSKIIYLLMISAIRNKQTVVGRIVHRAAKSFWPTHTVNPGNIYIMCRMSYFIFEYFESFIYNTKNQPIKYFLFEIIYDLKVYSFLLN